MVFSFFKKPPEKMVAKPSVVPRQKEAPEDAVKADTPASRPDTPSEVGAASELSDFVFSESFPQFQIEAEIDPIDASAEEAAMLYANGQDEATRVVLEDAIRVHAFGPGEHLWLMLFDLNRLSGNKPAFEAAEVDFARCFEKSPPGWGEKPSVAAASKAVAGSQQFRGELLGTNAAAFEAVRQALKKNAHLKLDLSGIKQLDAEGCEQLLILTQQARKNKCEIELLGRDVLGVMLQTKVESGVRQYQACWLLFLELCQLQGQREIFEDVAVDYAVTFEVSPPSWEEKRVASPEPGQPPADAEERSASEEAYALQGEIRALRFADLPTYAGSRDTVVIDCAGLVRMDFVSAGALLNVLTTIRRSGKTIVFRHPNRLVAELFAVVGLNAVANVVFAKY